MHLCIQRVKPETYFINYIKIISLTKHCFTQIWSQKLKWCDLFSCFAITIRDMKSWRHKDYPKHKSNQTDSETNNFIFLLHYLLLALKNIVNICPFIKFWNIASQSTQVIINIVSERNIEKQLCAHTLSDNKT
jgi:hypothetical protein